MLSEYNCWKIYTATKLLSHMLQKLNITNVIFYTFKLFYIPQLHKNWKWFFFLKQIFVNNFKFPLFHEFDEKSMNIVYLCVYRNVIKPYTGWLLKVQPFGMYFKFQNIMSLFLKFSSRLIKKSAGKFSSRKIYKTTNKSQ